MHHTKALDAFGRLSHRIHGASGRYSGSIQPVWCARPPVLNYQIEPPGRANAHDSSADKHCVFDVHHTRALDAFGRLSHRIHGASGRYFGSIQPVWCARPPVLNYQIEHLAGQTRMIPAQTSTACSICIIQKPSTHLVDSRTAFMVLGVDIPAQFSRFGALDRRF